jgi:Domain of Unknown Function (DUF1521)
VRRLTLAREGAIFKRFQRRLTVEFTFNPVDLRGTDMVSSVGNGHPSTLWCSQPPPLHQQTSRNAQGDAVYESDHYKITCNTRGEVTVFNKQSGETYLISGDPHVFIDGVHCFDFKETTTLLLADGTKVTIDTEPWGTDGATVASRVTVTKDNYGVQMDGVSLNNLQDEVTITEYQNNGHLLDKAVDDGTLLLENDFGTGFLSLVQTSAGISIEATTQALVNQSEASEAGGMFDRSATSNAALASILGESGGSEFLISYLERLQIDEHDADIAENDSEAVDEEGTA